MRKNKHFRINRAKNLLLFAFLLSSFFFAIPSVGAEDVAGCSDGPLGPPSPGSVCEDGSVPLADSRLPPGCPGSSQQGPPSQGAICPARPGRSECSLDQGACITSSGEDVTQGDQAANGRDFSESNFKGDCNDEVIDASNCGIVAYLLVFTNALSAIVGIVIVVMIVIGGIQYSSSRDNPQSTQAAKGRITNAIISLVLYLFMFAFLQYIVPGGVL